LPFGGMTTHVPFTCFGVAVRVVAVSAVGAVLFILDRIVPALLGFQFSGLQDATLYLWLVVLPLVGYAWVFQRSQWLASRRSLWRWSISLAGALLLSLAFACVTLTLIWVSG
jgi:hypothetical protein